MSFFLEAKRETTFKVQNTPSPFEYNNNPEHKKSSGYAPFGSAAKLSRGKNNDKERVTDFSLSLNDKNVIIPLPQQPSSMFKSKSERVMYGNSEAPGPGSYNLRTKFHQSKEKINKNHYSLSEKKMNPPSIPTDSYGFKVKNNEIEKIQVVKKPSPAPGTYELRENLMKKRGLSWNSTMTLSKKQYNGDQPGPGSYNVAIEEENRAPTSCFNSQSGRFENKKAKSAYTPGPGNYNLLSNRSNKHFSQTHFNSKISRFPIEKSSAKAPGPGSYNQDPSPVTTFNKKVLESYVDKEVQRKTIFNFENSNPGPGEYISKEGMTFELQKSLLRKYNNSQFPNSKREIFESKAEGDPGPGAYNIPQPKISQTGSLYKKVEVVKLKEGEETVSPSPFHYSCDNFTISNKLYKESKRMTLIDRKPFHSGAERFNHYKNSEKNTPRNDPLFEETDDQSKSEENNVGFEGQKKIKKLIMTSVKVKVPFGTSTSKFLQEAGNEEVGPGSYTSNKNWVKQTHSIKGKLNKKN